MMTKFYYSVAWTITLVIISIADVHAQYIPRQERGNPVANRATVIDVNHVRTTIFNYGLSGRVSASPSQVPYEWPKYSMRHYLASVGILIGGEVVDANGNTIQIVDVPAFRQSPSGQSWFFASVPGYQNPTSQQIARRLIPSTWPAFWPDKLDDPNDPGWPGSWNGLLGKNSFIADEEMYFHYADNLYDRHHFYPDSTDSTRAGLGIVVSQRVLQWSQVALADAVVFVYDIYNAGTSNIEKAALTVWVADLVGGDGDSSDDIVGYDLSRRIVYFMDADGVGNPHFGSEPVGVAALIFLQTPDTTRHRMDSPPLSAFGIRKNPDELGITNIQSDPAAGINFNTATDSSLWRKYMTPGSFNLPQQAGDYDLFASMGYFPLPAGGSQRLVTALIFAQDTASVDQKIDNLKNFFEGLTAVSQQSGATVQDYELSQNYPNPFNPVTVIKYQLPRASEVEISLFTLQGQKLATLVKSHQAAGTHTIMWNGADASGRRVASGVYLYQLQAGEFLKVKKMLVLR